MTMTIIPIIGLFFALIIFAKKYILTDEKVQEIADSLKEKRVLNGSDNEFENE